MGIIGVVAALTLPNLNSSTGDKEIVSKVNKIYSELNDAYGRATAVYGPYETWNAFQDIKKSYERISEFMKVTKTCGPNESGCFAANTFKSLKTGYTLTDSIAVYYKGVLASGMSVAIFPYVQCFDEDVGCGNFYVDIDGPNKGSNTLGKDIFIFVWTKDNGVIPFSIDETEILKCFKWGNSCAGWVIQNGNTDYKNADINGKCTNNNSIVLDLTTNTTCK